MTVNEVQQDPQPVLDESGRPKVHPALEQFPDHTDVELTRLKVTIETAGLLQPGVLDSQGRIIDGRARLEAATESGPSRCAAQRASTPARIAAIVQLNAEHRHLTTGQRAMLAARWNPR